MKFSDLRPCRGGLPIPLLLLLALAGLGPLGGCGEDKPSGAFREDAELDLGDDWDATATRDAARAASTRTTWAILLKTFTHAEHATAAARMIETCRGIDPALGNARVHAVDKGSMVVYGVYDSVDSASAKADLAWVKSIEVRGMRVFPAAMLTPIRGRGRAIDSPYDLAKVRATYPNVRPLYTLSVAIWGDFESGSMKWDRIVTETERYCRTLRAQGHDAYVFYDQAKMLGEVTVGVFGPGAIDPQSQILSREVSAVQEQFPFRLVNGETLRELVNARVAEMGTRLQTTRLVEIP